MTVVPIDNFEIDSNQLNLTEHFQFRNSKYIIHIIKKNPTTPKEPTVESADGVKSAVFTSSPI